MTTVICRIQYKSGAGNEGHITGPGGPLRLRRFMALRWMRIAARRLRWASWIAPELKDE